MGSIPRSGRSPGVGNGNLLQYSCLENSMDREIGVFRHVAPPTRLRPKLPHETGLILRCARKVGNPLQTEKGGSGVGWERTVGRGRKKMANGVF